MRVRTGSGRFGQVQTCRGTERTCLPEDTPKFVRETHDDSPLVGFEDLINHVRTSSLNDDIHKADATRREMNENNDRRPR